MDNSSGRPAVLDQVAVALSGLCLLHCLLLPFVVALLPFLGEFRDDHLHAEVLLFVIPVSVVALGLGFQRHRHLGIVVSGAMGLIILTLGGTVVHNAYGLLADRTMTVLGSITLAVTHYRNFRYSKAAACSSAE